MSKIPRKQQGNRKKRSDTATVVAAMSGRSARLVRMVMNGDVENEDILTATIMYEQEKSKLIQHIQQIVKFN